MTAGVVCTDAVGMLTSSDQSHLVASSVPALRDVTSYAADGRTPTWLTVVDFCAMQFDPSNHVYDSQLVVSLLAAKPLGAIAYGLADSPLVTSSQIAPVMRRSCPVGLYIAGRPARAGPMKPTATYELGDHTCGGADGILSLLQQQCPAQQAISIGG